MGSAWRPSKTYNGFTDQDHRRMSSGYPGHLGGAGPSSGHQSNPPYPSMTSRGTTPGGTHPPPSQLLPPSPAPSPQPHSPQVSSQKAVGSTGSQKAKWYFSPDRLSNTPSVEAGIPIEKELSYRQQAANFIQDMGQRLEVTQLCINTAIVYMQRFYMFHSFTRFHRNSIASAALFLAAKVEEQPRKLEHVIKVSHMCLHRGAPQLDTRSDAYMEQAQELVTNENILLQTLGFDVAIDHPHTHVVKCCQLVRAAKDLAQTSYFMATNSLHLTTMCLRFSPTIVACVCIHLACKWSNYKIPLSAQNKEWFTYIDNEATQDLLDRLTEEFLAIFEKCPSRLKKKIMSQAQDTKDVEEKRMKQGLRAHEFNLTTGDNTTQPQGRPPGGTGVPDAHHRSRHHGSHHGHSHHSRTNSSSSSTSTSSTAPVVNNANAHGHHMPTSSTKHMQHPNSASNKHIDQRHHRQDRPDGKSHSNKSIPPMMNNQSVVGTSNQPPPPSQSMVPQQQQPTFSNNYQVDQFGRPIKPPHNSRSTQQQHRGHPTQPPHSNRPSQQPQQQQQAWQQQQQQTADPQHRGRPDMSLFNQQQTKPQQRPHQPPQNQQNSRHSLPNGWSMRSQQQRPSHQPPPLPPSDPPKPQPPPPPLPLMGVDKKPPRSIFDIDSPPPTTMNTSTSSLSMSLSNPVKMEMGDIFENETDQQTDQTKPKSGRDISPSVVKLNKVENMTGFEKLRDGRPSIKVPHNQIKQEVKQEFMPDPNSMVVSIAPPELTHLEDSQHHHSSKKHKKEKKNKKKKKGKKKKKKKKKKK